MKKPLLIAGISLGIVAIFILVAAALYPKKSYCSVPGATCTTAPDANFQITRYYEVQPLILYLVEEKTGKDIGINYQDGYESEYYGPIYEEQ